jgi:hypothetical protein
VAGDEVANSGCFAKSKEIPKENIFRDRHGRDRMVVGFITI